jgi:hypothetical protein
LWNLAFAMIDALHWELGSADNVKWQKLRLAQSAIASALFKQDFFEKPVPIFPPVLQRRPW